MWKRIVFLLIWFCVISFCFASLLCAQDSQDVQAQQTLPLTQLSSNIKEKLQDLKTQSQVINARLDMLSKNLEISETERLEWKEQSTKLSTSLRIINSELSGCYKDIENYKRTLEERTVVLTWLAIFMVIRLLAVAIGYILYFKGIKVPRWLDILL